MSTDLRTAAQQAPEAKQVPLRELLASVPADARLVIDDADGNGTRFIPVGRLCQEAAAALAEPVQEPDPGEYHGWVLREVLFEKGEPVGHREPVQEPVAWRYKGEPWFDGNRWHDKFEVTTDERVAKFKDKHATPLYTAPPQRKPLTEDEIKACEQQSMVNGALPFEQRVFFARAVERAQGIGVKE